MIIRNAQKESLVKLLIVFLQLWGTNLVYCQKENLIERIFYDMLLR